MTRNTYTGNGTTTDFTFTFSYLDQSHVLATINGVSTTAFTFFSASVLRFTTAPANGSAVVIYRSTPSTNLLADFTAGSAIREQDLELDLQQVLNVAQELKTYVDLQSTAGLQAQITTATNNASSALTTAQAANTTANAASTTANGIAATANAANTTANTANTTANTALSTANGISATANAALSQAASAQTRADRAPALSTLKTGTGTSIDFTGIPSWVSRIIVSFADVSFNAGAHLLIQLGTSSGFETTGYVGSSVYVNGGVSTAGISSTTGYVVYVGSSVNLVTGLLTLVKISGNLWSASATFNYSNNNGVVGYSAGSKSLIATLDRLRLIGSNGTDTFDSGYINILYD